MSPSPGVAPAAPTAPNAWLVGGFDPSATDATSTHAGRGTPAPAGVKRVEASGAWIEYDPAHVSVHVDGSILAACIGAPRFDRAELARLASAQGSAAACASLFAAHGPDFAAHLRGAWAAVVVDRTRRRVVLAVDRFSTRTLCHAVEGGRLAFSDRADCVPLASPAPLDPQAIFDYLYSHAIPAPRTAFAGVLRLRGAHRLEFAAGGGSPVAYWRPAFDETQPVRFDELRDRFRSIIESAVARESAGGRTGCFLSGGTDSSTVAGMLARTAGSGSKVHAFSIGFDAAGYDEMEYARIAARRFGVEHHEHYITREELAAGIPLVAAWYDQPFGNSSVVPAYYCARVARQHGVERLLAGDGGDELFGGNSRYATQRVFEAYGAVPAPARRGLLDPLLTGVPVFSKLPLVRKAVSYVKQANVPLPDRLGTYNLLTRLGEANVLAPGLLAAIDVDEPRAQQRAVWAECQAPSLVNRMLAYDWKYTLADSDLPKVCGATAIAGIDVGFPLLADELVDFSLALAPAQKLKGLKLRYFFKEALRGFLPDEIITKQKHGFGLPFGVWVASHPALREFAADALSGIGRRGIVRADFVDELWNRRMAEHPGYYGEMVWLLLVLETWLRAHAPTFALR